MALTPIQWNDATQDVSYQINVLRGMVAKTKTIWKELLTGTYSGNIAKNQIAINFCREIILGLRPFNQSPIYLTQFCIAIFDDLADPASADEIAVKVSEAIDLVIESKYFETLPATTPSPILQTTPASVTTPSPTATTTTQTTNQ